LGRDIREVDGLTHDHVVGLNFIRTNLPYVFRRYYRTGLRSHIMAVLDPEDVRREREGVDSGGVRWYPGARPIRMLRIFRKRFQGLAHAQEELRGVKIIESFLAPDYMALSNEFLVDLVVGDSRELLLCGLQEYVEGEMIDPWGCLTNEAILSLSTRPSLQDNEKDPADEDEKWLRIVRHEACVFVDRVKKMALEALRIPDLAGVGNLLMTSFGRVKLVDINNVSRISFDGRILLDDRGYPVCDKSVEALSRLESCLGGRQPEPGERLYKEYLDPLRMAEVKALEREFHLSRTSEAPIVGAQ
jgi:hypothetical protein